MKNQYIIVSKMFYSNCLIEAVKAKIRNPCRVKIYFCKPKLKSQMPHFMWDDGKASYDFSVLGDNHNECIFDYFIFKGCIRKFDLNFAKKYSIYRNKKG